jgi:Response regulator containing a CheY-like receiver domain and a GGDEF domain
MNRILLADDSPHAQRMGELILREEGFEVVTVTNGETALLRLQDADPDLILADISLPGRSGYQICEYVKGNPRFRHTRVVLTAGLLEPIDEAEAQRVGSDGVLKKPFEASVVMETIRPLIEAAQCDRSKESGGGAVQTAILEATAPEGQEASRSSIQASPAGPDGNGVDPEQVRAAVTIALDAALPKIIDEITEKVLIALGHEFTHTHAR